MTLYVCYGTFKSRKPGGHPCRTAYQPLLAAGHDPEIIKTYGCQLNPLFPGRRHVKELTGNYEVPPPATMVTAPPSTAESPATGLSSLW